jgi:hypothetical protein
LLHPHRDKRDIGQTLILFAFAVVGLLALAALIIDGGSIYLNRRHAQTAADAGAIAAAYAKCVEKGSAGDIQAAAEEYAVTQNQVTAVESVEVDENGQVNVRTRMESPSFFASLLGQQTDVARAQAAAGCFPPTSTKNLLPVAWACGPPAGEASDDTCTIHQIPVEVFRQLQTDLGEPWFEQSGHLLDAGNSSDPANPDMNPDNYHDGSGGNMAYLVMDANVIFEDDCIELNTATDTTPGVGTITCDLDGDGILDVGGGGDRGWLALGANGASDLWKLMINGYTGDTTLPHWFQGEEGAIASVFRVADDNIRFHLVLVPVFDAICDGYSRDTLPSCPEYTSGESITDDGQGRSGAFMKVAAFAPFVVTCVHTAGEHTLCPAQEAAGGKAIDPQAKTMEGYFLSGVAGTGEIDPSGFDLGVYVISLTK